MSADWWKRGVFYQVYPRSFADSNGDGVGDIPGITSKLDYLADLGIEGLWLSPVYQSPMRDFGYDISDYRGIDPMFGTMADFDTLLREAHDRGIRIVMDGVFNHTSDQHPWFIESRSSRDSPRREWYIWRDGKGRKSPNNWQAVFGGRAWQWDERTSQYYLHLFIKEMPDLNWRSPALKSAVFDEIRFWLDRGVDGFRLDVVNLFVKDALFRDNPFTLGRQPRAYDMQKHIYEANQPETHGVLRELRALLDSYSERVSVGEVMVTESGDAKLAATFLGSGTDELHLSFDFTLLHTPWDPRRMARVMEEWYLAVPRDGWPALVLSNHDVRRSASRYGARNRPERARLLALLLLTLRGTPFIYYGEEIGMVDGPVPRRMMKDPVGLRYWPLNGGRDPFRTPMQWTADRNAGFTTGEPWLPIPGSHAETNVESERKDPRSLLSFYKALIRLRRDKETLSTGDWVALKRGEEGVIGYERRSSGETVAVWANLTGEPKSVAVDPSRYGRTLLSTHESASSPEKGALSLQPWEGVILDEGGVSPSTR